ncbi:sulfite exporter TauE/SafE family protein [Thermoplasma acidophilum]|nr:sulfite exporter TauE/SafE family protein [Thermoplasma acidophilum]MCY0851841.1 sulfite exporter TauE/SafE family protein [Thermoplasma acidophilum]
MIGALYIIILILTWILSAVFAISGVGAANTLIPIYYSFGIPFSIAAAAGLLLNVFSLSSATANNAKHSFILWKIGVIFLIPAVAMAPVGAMVGVHTPRKYLLIIFVVFLSYTLFNLISGRKKGKKDAVLTGISGAITGIFIGALAGFLGGLLGVGGGMIILPVLTFMESDYKKIAGTSAFIALFSSASGFLSYLAILRGVNYLLWIVVLIGGIAGGFTGSFLMHRFDSRKVRLLIIIIILFVTVKTAYSVSMMFH